jgi:L-lactate dehydrogenase complex protein LldE
VDVALFATCLTDQFYPRAGIAVVEVLERLGCRVSFPERQTCCGQPQWNNGYRAEARGLARRMIEVFEGAAHVVTPSGSCAAMVREAYPLLFEGDAAWLPRARALADRTYEFVEFLAKVLGLDPRAEGIAWRGVATYHYSCHLRGIGITDEAERLLERIEGLEYRRLHGLEDCCGFGGTFAVKYPWISGAMTREKVEAIAQTGASVVVSNDAGCTMTLSGACRREGVEVRFLTLAEILAEGMGLLERSSP